MKSDYCARLQGFCKYAYNITECIAKDNDKKCPENLYDEVK